MVLSPMDCLQILLNVFFAFLSALMGVLIGNWYTKRQLAKFRISEKQQLRHKLVDAFRFNIARLNQMSEYLSSNSQIIPDFRLDTESVSHILFHGRELFDDQKWFTRFNWERYQLTHINAKLDYLNDVINLAIPDENEGHTICSATVANQRMASLISRLPSLVVDIEKLILEFETEETQTS
jgi:hypothetical protein